MARVMGLNASEWQSGHDCETTITAIQGEMPPRKDETRYRPLALSFGYAKNWLMKQQSAHSIAIEAGTVNEF